MKAERSTALRASVATGLFALACRAPEVVVSQLPPEQLAATGVYYVEVDQGAERSIGVRVDPRIELFSILALLADYEEYAAPLDYAYSRAVLEHFEPFREHAAVKRMRSLRQWQSISHDAVVNLAVHVTDPPALAERVPFEPRPGSLGDRWTPRKARALLEDARRFAIDSDFTGFWRARRGMFEATEKRFAATLEPTPLLAWIDGFFRIEPGMRFRAVPGMLTGGANYGATCRSADQAFVYQVIGVSRADPDGTPIFAPDAVGVMVHEYSHAFANPVVERARDAFRGPGEVLFRGMREEMRRQAYGSWFSVMCESLVRAATVRYFAEHTTPARATEEVRRQVGRGFLWTGELAELFAEYEADRETYPTLDAFVPRMEDFFLRYTMRFPAILDEWESRLDHWRALEPTVDGALRREVVTQLHEVNRIVDRTSSEPEQMRLALDRMTFEHDVQVTILDEAGDFVYHVMGLTGTSYRHTDLAGREVYREMNESTERAGMLFNVDYVSDDRNAARVNVIAHERYEARGWLLCVEGHEWQSR